MALRITDLSGFIAVGGTAQSLALGFIGRRGLAIRNNHATQSLWLSELGAVATSGQPSWEVKAGEIFSLPGITDNAISIIGATTSQSYTARQW